MTMPSPVNRALAEAALDDFFNNENWLKRIEEYGWKFAMLDALTLIVTLPAKPIAGHSEIYTLRLSCDYYPTNPPDVRFVNPATFEYEVSKDKNHVADLRAPYCRAHLQYSYKIPYKYGPQLVCSSMTLGYYTSNHNPNQDQKWDPSRHSVGSSIYTVHRALHSEHYFGRHT